MYACVYVCIYIYIYICICVCMYVCMYIVFLGSTDSAHSRRSAEDYGRRSHMCCLLVNMCVSLLFVQLLLQFCS